MVCIATSEAVDPHMLRSALSGVETYLTQTVSLVGGFCTIEISSLFILFPCYLLLFTDTLSVDIAYSAVSQPDEYEFASFEYLIHVLNFTRRQHGERQRITLLFYLLTDTLVLLLPLFGYAPSLEQPHRQHTGKALAYTPPFRTPAVQSPSKKRNSLCYGFPF